jgi:hypothetical protein
LHVSGKLVHLLSKLPFHKFPYMKDTENAQSQPAELASAVNQSRYMNGGHACVPALDCQIRNPSSNPYIKAEKFIDAPAAHAQQLHPQHHKLLWDSTPWALISNGRQV